MTVLTFDLIPSKDASPKQSRDRHTSLTALPGSYRRRTVVRGMVLGAATLGTLVATSAGRLAPAARAETGPGGLTGWDRSDCKDAYPNGYAEQTDNVGAWTAWAGACFGGNYRGSTYCTSVSGWHKSGTVYDAPVTYYYKPISTACGTTTKKNAWRWTVSSYVWRCSDGNTTVSSGGTSHTYFTICRARL